MDFYLVSSWLQTLLLFVWLGGAIYIFSKFSKMCQKILETFDKLAQAIHILGETHLETVNSVSESISQIPIALNQALLGQQPPEADLDEDEVNFGEDDEDELQSSIVSYRQ